MPFDSTTKLEALVKSLRRCCVCRIFCGRCAEVHHIAPQSKGGLNALDNAIVLCPRCHGEAGHYNADHPVGNKYSPSELRRLRDEWWDLCSRHSGWSMPEDPLGIKPGKIVFGGPNRIAFGQFTLSNRTNDPGWSVWIRLTVDSTAVNLEDLEIDIIERYPLVPRRKRIGDFRLDTAHIVTNDEDGRRIRFLMIPQLRPSEYISYCVRIPSQPSSEESFELSLDLFDIGSEPVKMIFPDGKPSFNLSFPVPLKGKSSIWFAGNYPLKDS